MNLKDYPRQQYSINQFRQVHNTELAGKSFYFVMDDGIDYELSFTGATTCKWNFVGNEPKEATYECVKGDDTTYLVDFDLTETLNTDKRVNHLFIIDLAQRLVTRVICSIGYHPDFPYLVKSEYEFGAIRVEGKQLPFRRHCYSSELLGTSVEWHWTYTLWTQHLYYDADYYRITCPPESSAYTSLGVYLAPLPSADDVTRVIKIKDKMYLFCLTEALYEKILAGTSPFRSNNMIFLQNYNKMMHAGRTFGHATTPDGKTFACRTLFGSFGNPVHIPDSIVDGDNKYTV